MTAPLPADVERRLYSLDPDSVQSLDETTTHLRPDPARVAELAADMAARGWHGPPVLMWGPEVALTGTHRIAAAREVGMNLLAVDLLDLDPAADRLVMAAMAATTWWDGLTAASEVAALILGRDLADAWGIDLDRDARDLRDALDTTDDAGTLTALREAASAAAGTDAY